METRFICAHCGEEHAIETACTVQSDLLCSTCANELTTTCDYCETRIYYDDGTSSNGNYYCACCADDHFQTCTHCHCLVSNDLACYADDDDEDLPYCTGCYEEHCASHCIEAYSYKPVPIFHGKGRRFFGVELEIDEGGIDHTNAEALQGIANRAAEYLYIKTDGSLDDGLELVTHPLSLEVHQQQMSWSDILQRAVALGYRSHNTQTCGLHVHISRTAFGDTEARQEDAISRVLYFTERFWPELLRFSRRTQGQLNRWAARYGMQLHPKEILNCAKHSCQGRYTAVNLTNYDTVEFRMFRGTLKYNTLIATLQLVDAICDVAISFSDAELQDFSWHAFLERVEQKELIQHLKERNLYKNEPVSEAEVA